MEPVRGRLERRSKRSGGVRGRRIRVVRAWIWRRRRRIDGDVAGRSGGGGGTCVRRGCGI